MHSPAHDRHTLVASSETTKHTGLTSSLNQLRQWQRERQTPCLVASGSSSKTSLLSVSGLHRTTEAPGDMFSSFPFSLFPSFFSSVFSVPSTTYTSYNYCYISLYSHPPPSILHSPFYNIPLSHYLSLCFPFPHTSLPLILSLLLTHPEVRPPPPGLRSADTRTSEGAGTEPRDSSVPPPSPLPSRPASPREVGG